MDSRYNVVRATYDRRLQFIVITLFLALATLIYLAVAAAARGQMTSTDFAQIKPLVNNVGIGLVAVGLSWLAGTVAGHMKEQLASWRTKLMPGYRTPHLVVGGLLLALLTIVIPFAVSQLLQVSALGLIAIVIWTSAAWAWVAQLQTVWSIIILVGVWVAPGVPVFRDVLIAMMRGEASGVSLLMITVGAVALLGVLARLAFMHEEMVEYFRLGTDPSAQLRPAMTGDATQIRLGRAGALWPNIAMLGPDRLLKNIRNVRDASLIARARHWRKASGNSAAPWIVASLISLAALLLVPRGEGFSEQLYICTVMMWSVLPALVQPPFWPGRWPMLGYELTRPTDRRRFIQTMFIGMGWDVFASCLAFVFIGVITLAIRWPGAVAPALASLIVVLPMQIWMGAGAIWVMRLRSLWIGVLALQAAIAAPIISLIRHIDREDHLSTTWSLRTGTFFIIAAVIIAFDAYRRWLNTELD